MYVKIYAPDGEMVEVTRQKADELILNFGWTQNAPVFEEPDEESDWSFDEEVVEDSEEVDDE
jgi:hypothetical protein